MGTRQTYKGALDRLQKGAKTGQKRKEKENKKGAEAV